MDVKQNIINESYDDIKQIEQDIIDLNEMFITLNQLVNSQGENINCIEDNIANTKSLVEQGNKELEKANKYIVSNRLFWTGAMIGGIVSGVATYGLSLGIWSISTVGGGIVGVLLRKIF